MILLKVSVFALLTNLASCAFTIYCEINVVYREVAAKKLTGFLDNAAKIWECGKNFDQDTFSECIENEESLNSYRNVVLTLTSADFENEASFRSGIKKCGEVFCNTWNQEEEGGTFTGISIEGGNFSDKSDKALDTENRFNEQDAVIEVEDKDAEVEDPVEPGPSSNDPVEPEALDNKPVKSESSDKAMIEPEAAQKPSINVVESGEYDLDFKRPKSKSNFPKKVEYADAKEPKSLVTYYLMGLGAVLLLIAIFFGAYFLTKRQISPVDNDALFSNLHQKYPRQHLYPQYNQQQQAYQQQLNHNTVTFNDAPPPYNLHEKDSYKPSSDIKKS